MPNDTIKVLHISASGRNGASVSRRLSADVIAALNARHNGVDVIDRDVAAGVPFVDESWIEANFTPEDARSDEHREALAYSDALVAELQAADILVIGVPVYNFSIPATLKAWIDMITRARVTFRYTSSGPEGLLTDKKVYIVVATGGVGVGSAVDFATPYLKHALAFIGLTDVEVIAAEKLNSQAEESLDAARMQIAERVHLGSEAA
jgi:FMN-dependent NADH-azoreductase